MLGARQDSQVAAEVAAHWAAAGKDAEELSCTVTAAEAAERIYAFDEAAQLWERVAVLWDLVEEKPVGLAYPLCMSTRLTTVTALETRRARTR